MTAPPPATAPPAGDAARLRPQLAARVAVVARVAAEMDIATYLVGGTVRDLLLGRDSPDLDFVAVGDGFALAVAVERELGGRLVWHSAFLTADVIDGEGVHLDLATARRESYAAVAALPEVLPAALEDDLRRRDFTVNAMALGLPLNPAAAGGGGEDEATGGEEARGGDAAGGRGEAGGGGACDLGSLVDVVGGRRDLEAGALRVLHDRSFLDDPTRVLRGVRLEARLGFRMTARTEELAREAVGAGAFARLSGGRLRHELELLLGAEPAPAAPLAGLERLQELGVLAAVHPRLTLDEAARQRLLDAATEYAWHQAVISGITGVSGVSGVTGVSGVSGVSGVDVAGRAAHRQGPPVRRWLLLLLALAAGLDEAERGELGARLLLAGDALRLLTGCARRLAAALPRLGAAACPHEVDAALAGLEEEELLLLAASTVPARPWVRRYLTELRPLALGIGGADLLAVGARRGPGIGRALRATRAARLDGAIDAGEELEFALARWREAQEEAGAASR